MSLFSSDPSFSITIQKGWFRDTCTVTKTVNDITEEKTIHVYRRFSKLAFWSSTVNQKYILKVRDRGHVVWLDSREFRAAVDKTLSNIPILSLQHFNSLTNDFIKEQETDVKEQVFQTTQEMIGVYHEKSVGRVEKGRTISIKSKWEDVRVCSSKDYNRVISTFQNSSEQGFSENVLTPSFYDNFFSASSIEKGWFRDACVLRGKDKEDKGLASNTAADSEIATLESFSSKGSYSSISQVEDDGSSKDFHNEETKASENSATTEKSIHVYRRFRKLGIWAFNNENYSHMIRVRSDRGIVWLDRRELCEKYFSGEDSRYFYQQFKEYYKTQKVFSSLAHVLFAIRNISTMPISEAYLMQSKGFLSVSSDDDGNTIRTDSQGKLVSEDQRAVVSEGRGTSKEPYHFVQYVQYGDSPYVADYSCD